MTEKSYRAAIRDAMMEERDRDGNVRIMGEDIGVYESTFRITAGMLKKYGPKRVIDTPIAEAGMAGKTAGGGEVCPGPPAPKSTRNFPHLRPPPTPTTTHPRRSLLRRQTQP